MVSRVLQLGCGGAMIVAACFLAFLASPFLLESGDDTASHQLIVALVSVAISMILLFLATRLLFRRPRRDGGLLPPWALRLAASCFIALPIAALLAGQASHPRIGWFQLLVQGGIYLLVGARLFQLARARESPPDPTDDPQPDD